MGERGLLANDRPNASSFLGKRDFLVRELRHAILNGDLMVGQRLRQDELAELFHVSSTPVREALRVLEAQGLVAYEANRGVTVKDFGGSFDQVYRLREALERLATEMAVPRIDDDRGAELIAVVDAMERAEAAGDAEERHRLHRSFHLMIYESCDFPALIEMINMVWARFPWDELLVLPGLASVSDHRTIAELVRSGDAVAAGDALREHVATVRDHIVHVSRARHDEGAPAGEPAGPAAVGDRD